MTNGTELQVVHPIFFPLFIVWLMYPVTKVICKVASANPPPAASGSPKWTIIRGSFVHSIICLHMTHFLQVISYFFKTFFAYIYSTYGLCCRCKRFHAEHCLDTSHLPPPASAPRPPVAHGNHGSTPPAPRPKSHNVCCVRREGLWSLYVQLTHVKGRCWKWSNQTKIPTHRKFHDIFMNKVHQQS